MGHVETNPDIFRAHETYVPVRWDLADLEAHCLHYLSHQAERERIVKTAFETVRDFYENGGFVRRFREISARVLPTR
jgi:hypothetical protein